MRYRWRMMHHKAGMFSGAAPLGLRQLSLAEYAAMAPEFAALAAKAADPNPHMSPASVSAAASLLAQDDIVILAVTDQAHGHALAGIWALGLSRPAWAMGIPVLTAPVLPLYDVLSLPVVDASQLGPVLDVMLAHVVMDPLLPRLIRCPALATGTATGKALLQLLPKHRAKVTLYESWQRAILKPGTGITADDYLRAGMGHSYKNYMAKRRALERSGKIGFAMHRREAAIAALPRFLALEASGWKGKAGTAMASNPRHAAYAAELVIQLAAQDEVMIAELTRDGTPLSMGLLPVSGGTSCFIKAAYDEQVRKHAPGFLLQMEVTAALMADPGFRLMDSGMDDTGDIMVWSERRGMAHGLIALGTAPTAWLAAHGLALRQRLRHARRHVLKG